MTIEIGGIFNLGAATPFQTVELPYPMEIYEISITGDAAVGSILFSVYDQAHVSEPVGSNADTIYVDDEPQRITFWGRDGNGAVTLRDFEPVPIQRVLEMYLGGSGVIGVTLLARPIDIPAIQDDLTRDLAAELSSVTDPYYDDPTDANDISPGDQFYQVRLRNLRQVDKA